jgi:hypothetical protein
MIIFIVAKVYIDESAPDYTDDLINFSKLRMVSVDKC